MTVLRMREAAFCCADASTFGPFTLDVRDAEVVDRPCGTRQEASLLAMLACAIARPTGGSVTIAEYDTRIQPARCKRVAAFVPHDPLPMTSAEFAHHIEYRAALWNVDAARARARARLTLERLHGVHEAFAYPVAAAAVFAPLLVVFDRPPEPYAGAMIEAVAPSAVLVARAAEMHA